MPAAINALASSIAPGRGIALMLAGTFVLTVNDATMKWLGGHYPVGQIMFMRGLFSLLPVALLVWYAGGLASLRIRAWRAQALRGALVVASTFAFVTGVTLMPLADAIAILFTGPLFIVALAPWLLGERIGWRRWAAVGVGFCGALIMVRPTGAGWQFVALLPLASAFMGALRDIITRRLSAVDGTNATLLVTMASVPLVAVWSWPVGMVWTDVAWVMPSAAHLGLAAMTGLLLGTAHFCMIEAFRLAEAGVLAPFKYTNFLWALLLGFLIWGDLPGPSVLLGAGLVICSGLYVLHRELRRRPVPLAVPRNETP